MEGKANEMSLRDYFAIMILKELVSSKHYARVCNDMAEDAYRLAVEKHGNLRPHSPAHALHLRKLPQCTGPRPRLRLPLHDRRPNE